MSTYHLWRSAIHGFILFQSGSKILQSSNCQVCPNCRRDWGATPAKSLEHAKYSRAVSEYDPSDVVATLPSGFEAGEEHEQASEKRESIDTTNETSRLMYQDA